MDLRGGKKVAGREYEELIKQEDRDVQDENIVEDL